MFLNLLADPERFERPTLRFVVRHIASLFKGRADDTRREPGISWALSPENAGTLFLAILGAIGLAMAGGYAAVVLAAMVGW